MQEMLDYTEATLDYPLALLVRKQGRLDYLWERLVNNLQ